MSLPLIFEYITVASSWIDLICVDGNRQLRQIPGVRRCASLTFFCNMLDILQVTAHLANGDARAEFLTLFGMNHSGLSGVCMVKRFDATAAIR